MGRVLVINVILVLVKTIWSGVRFGSCFSFSYDSRPHSFGFDIN